MSGGIRLCHSVNTDNAVFLFDFILVSFVNCEFTNSKNYRLSATLFVCSELPHTAAISWLQAELEMIEISVHVKVTL